MKFIVYKTTNLTNGKEYVGKHSQKIDPYEFDGYYGSGSALKYAIKKYGSQNFKRETLFVFDNEEDAYKKEFELVNKDTVKNLYNIKDGGIGTKCGLIYVFSKKEQSYKMIRKENFNNEDFEILKDNRRTTSKNTIFIQDILTKKIKRISRDVELPAGFMIWKQDIGNKNKKMYFNKDSGEIKYSDYCPDGFSPGHPNGGITSGMIYINNGLKSTLIKKGVEIPDGWMVGRGSHKTSEYIWIHNPETFIEMKINKESILPEGFSNGRSPKIIIWLENFDLKLFMKFSSKDKIPYGWEETEKSPYIRKKLIKNKEYKIHEKETVKNNR